MEGSAFHLLWTWQYPILVGHLSIRSLLPFALCVFLWNFLECQLIWPHKVAQPIRFRHARIKVTMDTCRNRGERVTGLSTAHHKAETEVSFKTWEQCQ